MRLILYKNIFLFSFLLILISQCTLPEIADIDPPVVGLLYPYEGGVVSGDIIVSVQATDDRGVKSVWYTLDGKKINEKNGSGYVFELNVASYADEQQHVFQAMANDEAGNVGASNRAFVTISKTGDIIPPTVQIVNPFEGQQVADTVKIIAQALDNKSIKKVVFFIDGDSIFSDITYPYDFLLRANSLLSLGEHTIFARAYDTSRNFTNSDVIHIIVAASLDQIPPSIVLLYPLGGSTLTGIVNIASDISDNTAISSVEYFVDGGTNGNPDYISTSAPWHFEWNTTAWADSARHTIYIKAVDTAGNVGTLGPISYVIE
jgi:hypothetical protein